MRSKSHVLIWVPTWNVKGTQENSSGLHMQQLRQVPIVFFVFTVQ